MPGAWVAELLSCGDDDLLHLKSGDQRLRMIIRREGCKKSEGRSVISFGDMAKEGDVITKAYGLPAVQRRWPRRLGGVSKRGDKYISALLPLLC